MKDVKNILQNIKEIISSGKKAALCIIIETKGSSPRKAGSKMIVFEDGRIEGTVGGGSLEMQVIKNALQVISNREPKKFIYDLDNDMDMNCGGYTEVYIEPVLPQQQLFIFGAGHIGKALAKYAPDFGFAITIIDNREGLEKEFDQNKIRFLNKEYVEATKEIEFTEQSFIVIVTPKHAYDEDVLAICAKKQFAYLGMIGSKNKVALARKRMLSENILSEEELDKVDMPIGIKFNAQTSEEIAISILAKLIDRKNRKNL